MDFYTPTSLFRQNAMTKVRSHPQFSTAGSRKSSNESWLYKEEMKANVIRKACPNDKNKIASSYWKVPDDEMHLTSVAVNKENNEQVAVASGKRDSNLFIYDINTDLMSLTHQQTITLPHIQSLQWLSYDQTESMLMTGHKNGTVHMVSVPDSYSEESARIVKRYNHKKHFTTERFKSLMIKNIVVPNWIGSTQTFLTQCNENIFMWDMNHRSDLPIIKNQNLGLHAFDASPSKNGILALAGEFGIALNDLRAPVNTPSIFTPKDSFSIGPANTIKWAPYDENVLAASHLDGTVRLWDIRAQESFGKLDGHRELVTSIEWSEESSCDLYTSGNDGSIIHWELDFMENLNDCCLNEGLEAIKYMGDKFLTDETDIYAKVNKRQCGTLIPAAKTHISGMTSVGNMILSIDGSSYLGLHGKRGLDSFTVNEGTSVLMMNELLKELPSSPQSEGISSDSEEESIFERMITDITTPNSTAHNSPIHNRQKSITNFTNKSENSIDTLVERLHIPHRTVERRTSESTLNSAMEQDQEDVVASFTYEKILPLAHKLPQVKETTHPAQAPTYTNQVRSMII